MRSAPVLRLFLFLLFLISRPGTAEEALPASVTPAIPEAATALMPAAEPPPAAMASETAAPAMTAGTTDTVPADARSLPAGDDATPADRTWITRDAFERQLKKLHAQVPDANAGLFGPDSMMWRISRYMAPGGLGAGRALLLQISHPWITAGIDEHSVTRKDPLKRARDTFRYILTMVYGTREQALAAAHDVRIIHDKVKGHMPYNAGPFAQGSEYRANEMKAMIWVHATLWETLMLMYEESVGPVSDFDKERYYEETKLFAYLFGIPEEALPAHWWDFLAYCQKMREEQLAVTPASKELASYLFGVHSIGGAFLWLPMQYEKLVTAANMPDKLREGYGFGWGPTRNLVYTTSMATVRGMHHVFPDFLLENPAYKEAMARIEGRRAWPLTRFELWVAFGSSRLTNDY